MMENGLSLDQVPKVKLRGDDTGDDPTNSPTAYYEPDSRLIVLFTKGRHPKDVLRSFAHEMIHAAQHADGQLESDKLEGAHSATYAQDDKHLRKMEEDAYLRGNMMFRDWTDSKKKKLK